MYLLALLLAVTQTLPTVSVQGPERFEGRWKPDQEANSILARSELSKRGGPDAGQTQAPRAAPPSGGMGGMGGMDSGGGGGGGPGSGGGAPPSGGGGAAPSQPVPEQLESAESRTLTPAVDDLLVAGGAGAVIFASGPRGLLQLPVNGQPVVLADGKTHARLQRIDDDLVVTLDHPDALETLTYHLEGDGRRLRITSTVDAPGLGVPLSRQRLYTRSDTP